MKGKHGWSIAEAFQLSHTAMDSTLPTPSPTHLTPIHSSKTLPTPSSACTPMEVPTLTLGDLVVDRSRGCSVNVLTYTLHLPCALPLQTVVCLCSGHPEKATEASVGLCMWPLQMHQSDVRLILVHLKRYVSLRYPLTLSFIHLSSLSSLFNKHHLTLVPNNYGWSEEGCPPHPSHYPSHNHLNEGSEQDCSSCHPRHD